MKKMYIYEPAMCCETGLCGVGADPELLRISTIFNSLKKNGIIVERYNLANAPQEFINNEKVNQLIMKYGVDSLPATVVDGEIVKTNSYPTNEEIAALLDVSVSLLENEDVHAKKVKVTLSRSSGCGCKGGCC